MDRRPWTSTEPARKHGTCGGIDACISGTSIPTSQAVACGCACCTWAEQSQLKARCRGLGLDTFWGLGSSLCISVPISGRFVFSRCASGYSCVRALVPEGTCRTPVRPRNPCACHADLGLLEDGRAHVIRSCLPCWQQPWRSRWWLVFGSPQYLATYLVKVPRFGGLRHTSAHRGIGQGVAHRSHLPR
jgi:hypothetical protein